jgi:hypothetical protein
MSEIILEIDRPSSALPSVDTQMSTDAYKRQQIQMKQEPYMNSLVRAMSANPNEAYISWQQQQQQQQNQQYNQAASMILAQQQQQNFNQALKAGIKPQQIHNENNQIQVLPHDFQIYSNLPGPNQQFLDLRKIQADSKYATESETVIHSELDLNSGSA